MQWKRKNVMKGWLLREEDRVPKGYVPVVVGRGLATERFVVPLMIFKNPCMVSLLEMAAQEFGYQQQGTLTIPCDVGRFRWIVEAISKPRGPRVLGVPLFPGDLRRLLAMLMNYSDIDFPV